MELWINHVRINHARPVQCSYTVIPVTWWELSSKNGHWPAMLNIRCSYTSSTVTCWEMSSNNRPWTATLHIRCPYTVSPVTWWEMSSNNVLHCKTMGPGLLRYTYSVLTLWFLSHDGRCLVTMFTGLPCYTYGVLTLWVLLHGGRCLVIQWAMDCHVTHTVFLHCDSCHMVGDV